MRFQLGQTVATRQFNFLLEEDINFRRFVNESFEKYINCDWGETHEADKPLNDSAVENNDDRILASYENKHYKIWIITEWDRSVTTILFPEDY